MELNWSLLLAEPATVAFAAQQGYCCSGWRLDVALIVAAIAAYLANRATSIVNAASAVDKLGQGNSLHCRTRARRIRHAGVNINRMAGPDPNPIGAEQETSQPRQFAIQEQAARQQTEKRPGKKSHDNSRNGHRTADGNDPIQ